MKRIVGTLLLVGLISGCVNVDGSPETGGARPNYGRSFGPPSVPGVEGPYGTPVSMAAPYNTAPPSGPWSAARMMDQNVPMNRVQMNPGGGPMMGPMGQSMPPMMGPPGGSLSPPGIPFMPGMPGAPFGPGGPTGPSLGGGFPPGGNLAQASFQEMGQRPGVMPANVPPGGGMPGNVTQAQFAATSPVGPLFPAQRTQVFFSSPGGMKVFWSTQGKDGQPSYSVYPLETPGRYNFAQGAIYRLKLERIPGRPGLPLYPTLEVVPTSPKTNEFLAHNSVPLEFTEDDFRQVVNRNYIVKVIYLPDPQFQDVAGAGPDEINSTKLEPGQDPIQEALRRGSILLVLRIGNIDQEARSTPPLSAPVPGGGPAPLMAPPGMGVPPVFQVPFFGPQLTRPGLMPVPTVGAPPLPPPPPGLGAEAERRKPVILGPLPPLPGEQKNKNDLKVPFGPPDLPQKQGENGPSAPPNNALEGGAPSPLAPLPLLVLPAEESKAPAQVGTKTPTAPVVPDKAELNPSAMPPKAATEGIPVSNPRSENMKGSAQPAQPPMDAPPLPESGGKANGEQSKSNGPTLTPAVGPAKTGVTAPPLPPMPALNLPPMPGSVERSKGPALEVLGPDGTPARSTTSVSPPRASPGLELPPLNPELMNGPGMPAIPPVPSASETK